MELQLQNFDLKQISESGQCFRMWETEPGHFKMMARDRFLEAWQEPGLETVRFDCSRETFDVYWHRYFDLDRDYRACFDLIPPGDSYLAQAAA
ncbi:MAG: DNA glycosylase, partial [Lachnospiraceae bacterium]|nr:DNA glycosylase [Lachnospiraceae bacterium]